MSSTRTRHHLGPDLAHLVRSLYASASGLTPGVCVSPYVVPTIPRGRTWQRQVHNTEQGRQRARIGSSPGCTLVRSVSAAHTPASPRSQCGHRRYLRGSARAVGGRLAPLPVPAPGCRTRYRDPAYLPVPTTYPRLRVLPWGYVGARASSELRAFSSIPATHPMLRLFCLADEDPDQDTSTPPPQAVLPSVGNDDLAAA
jgi:hypothetical protein